MSKILAISSALLLATLAVVAPARADEDCGDLGRNYELIKRDAVSVRPTWR
jgi:hypothetical protein